MRLLAPSTTAGLIAALFTTTSCSALYERLAGGSPDDPEDVEAGDPPSEVRARPVGTPADPSFWDVVVITLDTTRADHLPIYGYFRDTAPTLSSLAARSLVFDRLVVPMATTLPTHTSLFTGVYPLEHGVVANVEHGGRQFVPSEQLLSLSTWLDSEGYQTGGFTSCAPLNPTTGIERGFQVFTAPKGELRPGRVAADDAIAFVGTAAPTPLLVWVHFYEPHNPYNPDEAYKKLFGEDERLGAWLDARKVDKMTKRPTGEPVRARPTVNAYDAEIRTMDDQIARVMEAIEARGRMDRTVVVIMGDHGEGLNQHGEPGHGLVWEEQLHAPLLLLAPGLSPGRVTHTISAVDVLPTALAHAELPHEQRLLSQVTGRDVTTPEFVPRPVLSMNSDRQLQFGRTRTWALTNQRWKCQVEEGGATRVWDLQADPYELADGTAFPAEAERCGAEVAAIIEAQKARGASFGSGQTREMTPEQLQMLKDLGYLDPRPPPKGSAPDKSPTEATGEGGG